MPLVVVSTIVAIPSTYYIYKWMTDDTYRAKLKADNPKMYDFMLSNIRISLTLKTRAIKKQVAELEKRARKQGLLDDAETAVDAQV